MSDTPQVKKAYEEVVGFLQKNKTKSVADVFEDVVAMCKAKSSGGVATASATDKDGNVVAIRCSFFGKWFPLSHVEFGKKAGSSNGYNPMCKEGANAFSKRQREFGKARSDLLDGVASGDVEASSLKSRLAKLETARNAVPAFSVAGMGWDTSEECMKQSKSALDAIVKAAAPKEVSGEMAAE